MIVGKVHHVKVKGLTLRLKEAGKTDSRETPPHSSYSTLSRTEVDSSSVNMVGRAAIRKVLQMEMQMVVVKVTA